MKLAFNLSKYYFWLVYCMVILNSLDSVSRQPTHNIDDELENWQFTLILGFQRMIFCFVTKIISQPMINTKQKPKQILVIGISELQLLNQKIHKPENISN